MGSEMYIRDSLHLDGIVTFSLGIEGDKTFQTELEYIASSAENVLRVVDFDALPLNLSYTLCSSKNFLFYRKHGYIVFRLDILIRPTFFAKEFAIV